MLQECASRELLRITGHAWQSLPAELEWISGRSVPIIAPGFPQFPVEDSPGLSRQKPDEKSVTSNAATSEPEGEAKG